MKECMNERMDLDQPRIYTTAALQQSNVALTWDETDPERTKLTRKAFDKDTLDKLDLKYSRKVFEKPGDFESSYLRIFV